MQQEKKIRQEKTGKLLVEYALYAVNLIDKLFKLLLGKTFHLLIQTSELCISKDNYSKLFEK